MQLEELRRLVTEVQQRRLEADADQRDQCAQIASGDVERELSQ